MSVKELRQEGYGIKVSHLRYYYTEAGYELLHKHDLLPDEVDLQPESKGGETRVELTDYDGNTYIGVARCHSNDNYVKKLGVAKALGRALQLMYAHNSVVL